MLSSRIFLYLLFLVSCTSEQRPATVATPVSSAQTAKETPFFFRIIGDFDGDKKADTLTEYMIGMTTGKQYLRFDMLDSAMYDSLALMARYGELMTYIVPSNPKFDSMPIPQALGIAFLRNEGDLDGDGADEFSYVPQWPDMTSVNAYYLTSWKRGKWKRIYSFRMREWQLPPTPNATQSYGYFGSTGHMKIDESYTDTLLKMLSDFTLVKKLAPGLIRIMTVAEQDYGDSIAIAESMLAEVKLQDDTGKIVKVMLDTSGRD